MAHAQVSDVTDLWAKDPEPEVETLITRRLEQVERMLLRRIPDLLAQIAADPTFAADVKDIESDAVLRLVRNPDGYMSESDGDYTYMLRSELSSGKLEILPAEWEILGVTSSKMFQIVPTYVLPT